MKEIHNKYLEQAKSNPENGRALALELREKAKKSDVEASKALVVMLVAGIGIEKNLSQGVKTAEAIARDKKLHDMNELLGHLFKFGLYGISIDHSRAEGYYRLAANAGLPQAAKELGKYYLDGTHFTQDISEGLRWLNVACERKEPEALGMLGELYLTGGTGLFGDYIQADSKKAIEYLSEANKLGNETATETLLLHFLKQSIELSTSITGSTPELRAVKSTLSSLGWLT